MIHAGLLVMLAASALYAQTVFPCPRGIPDTVVCYSGQDDNGAYYLIAIPKDWNGTLILYTHGGPAFSAPGPLTSASDLGPAVLLLPEGVAAAASSYRDYGFPISQDAEDTENLRRIFVNAFGSPNRTLALAASFGGDVTAKLVELYGTAPDGTLNYDGAMIGCGTVAGFRRIGEAFLDFRTVYQYYCQNLPLPDEPQYELWRGLDPASGRLDEIYNNTLQMLRDRGNACTGFLLPADQRSQEQQTNLANILNVMRIPESEFVVWLTSHGTFSLYDIATRMGGRNAFSNLGVVYQGSTDDEALNRGVARYVADPDALAAFSADAEPTGQVGMPIMTLHGIGDYRVIVENETVYRETLQNAGTEDVLLQTYVNTTGHCVFSVSELQADFHAFLNWLDSGQKPAPDEIAAACENYRAVNGDQCRFDPNYHPGAWESRVNPRVP